MQQKGHVRLSFFVFKPYRLPGPPGSKGEMYRQTTVSSGSGNGDYRKALHQMMTTERLIRKEKGVSHEWV